ncbi:alpha/beta hydrolase [uncultured Tolumonas sp.]|uniref:alpha/beta hydrolase n=1 Tax=uncultured Tolumonas sp. TaxID=263765 RepID=UPI002A0A0EF2|nr:alpha/beta hydrolase [uncultured Tolumonas sp.]
MKSTPWFLLLATLLSTSVSLAAEATHKTDTERHIPAHTLPVPNTVSPQLQAMIAAGTLPVWNVHPQSVTEWKNWVKKWEAVSMKVLPELREKMGVTVTPSVIAGVQVFTVIPKTITENNRDRLLLYVHGGGYVLFPGESGTSEAIMMASHDHIKVVAIDYRMPPDFPYPAGLNDVMSVYKEIVKTTDPKKLAIFGTSAGGGMLLSMVLRAKDEGLPLPGAIAAGTPWSDLTNTGDSYYTNENVDNVLVTNNGLIRELANLYAHGHDLKDPFISPVYGDMHGFPPTILTSGTRDLFLSNTVRVHRKLREAGSIADLIVFEGMSHAQYMMLSPDAPESQQYFSELSAFFDKHLAK